MSRNRRILDEEHRVLSQLVYRSRNQHKSSQILRRMTHLDRLLRKSPFDKKKIIECCQNLYIAGSSQVTMGYFLPLSICVMGCAARIFYLVSKLPGYERTQIDDIFAEF
ncbi:hypothetical protein PAEPH01_1276 [Pancytospora epiphaga]|nr:hypothetical protein PAEPH01_1276 [Pancytospora epiphaga]